MTIHDRLIASRTDLVKNEPMLFNCDVAAALELGGPLTEAFVDGMLRLGEAWQEAVIDSRVHMLMPGFYPCIPGWHHDDVPRTRSDGQPNYDAPISARHVMMLVNGEIAPTEFALGEFTLPEIPIGQRVYEQWHPLVEKRLEAQPIRRWPAPSGLLIEFDWRTLHRGTAAVSNGWRFFIRASINTKRQPTNEVRRQVQVYLPTLNQGW